VINTVEGNDVRMYSAGSSGIGHLPCGSPSAWAPLLPCLWLQLWLRRLRVLLSWMQDENIPIVAQFLPSKQLSAEEAEKIAQMGNSPTFVSMEHMRKVVPLWQDLSVQIYKNELSNKVRLVSHSVDKSEHLPKQCELCRRRHSQLGYDETRCHPDVMSYSCSMALCLLDVWDIHYVQCVQQMSQPGTYCIQRGRAVSLVDGTQGSSDEFSVVCVQKSVYRCCAEHVCCCLPAEMGLDPGDVRLCHCLLLDRYGQRCQGF